MPNAARDENHIPTLIGVSSIDGFTPTKVKANPVSGALLVEASIDTTGLATSAKQDTGNTSLGSIDTKTPALGQALAAASVPVVITAAQLATLTPPAAITGFATETTLALIKNTDGIKKITDALPAGTAIIGKVGIDQTTPGTTNAVVATGDVANAGTDSGNPVKVGGKYNSTTPTYTDGQRGDMQLDNKGSLKVAITQGGTGVRTLADNADGVAVLSSFDKLAVQSRNTVYNGTSWDRMPGDTTGIKVQSHAVTNAGTFAVQSTLAAETTKVIGTVNVAASQTIAVTNATAANLKAELGASTAAIGKLAANSGVDIGDVDVTSIVPGVAATNLGKAEDAAHTSGDVGVMMLGVRNEGHDDFSGTDKDYIPFALNASGDLFVEQRHSVPAGTNIIGTVIPYTPSSGLASGATAAMTGTTSTAVIAGTASNYLYITSILVTNSHATVGTLVTFQDGSAGTTLWQGYAAPVGGGFQVTFPSPLKVPTAGNGLYVVNDTTGSNTYACASGYKSTV